VYGLNLLEIKQLRNPTPIIESYTIFDTTTIYIGCAI
jgi:hypothetical protein